MEKTVKRVNQTPIKTASTAEQIQIIKQNPKTVSPTKAGHNIIVMHNG